MLQASDITFERYYRPVFQPVSFSLDEGELLLVTGSNGSGKTTLIRLLAGLLRPDTGTLQVHPDSRVYVGHQLAVKDDLSVRENLECMRGMIGSPASDVAAAIRRLGLARLQSRDARTLSAGQRKRCALARLLLSPARLWLLDEPYSNLDTEGIGIVDEVLRGHLAGGGACVMSTHGSLRPAGDIRLAEIVLNAAGVTA